MCATHASGPRRYAGGVAEDDRGWVLDLDRQLTRLSRTLRSPALHAVIGRLAGVDIDEHLYLTLAHISSAEPVRVGDLAASLDLERSGASRRASQLVAAGLVERTVDPDDRRAAVLRLGPAGRRALDAVQSAWLTALAGITADWQEGHRDEAVLLLGRLGDRLRTFLDSAGGR
jgi:DNA-binding MarR family transcriptional regulator